MILTYYGVLFLLALPFLGLRSRPLLALAAAWLVVGPGRSPSWSARTCPERQFANPSFDRLVDPGQLLSELFFTGYYPACRGSPTCCSAWPSGALDLRSRRVQAVLVGTGLVAAVVATVVSRVLTRTDSVAATSAR